MRSLLAVTPGDPNGIGPEIVWKTIRQRKFGTTDLLCFGARAPFEKLKAPIIEVDPVGLTRSRIQRSMKAKSPTVFLVPTPTTAKAKSLPGFQSGWAIEAATRAVLAGQADAIVTGPISKERLQAGGYSYPGHTEFLADLCGVPEVTMMLANETLRISLVTTHEALAKVPSLINFARIERAVEHTATSLRKWWGIQRPKIAVAALNPHAGEGGIFGQEERQVIEPALKRLRARGQYVLDGPLPADTLFAKHVLARPKDRWDAVVCMYHDQGLIPVKLLDFPRTVNVTLGLPIVRTSVDHGVGFDIAGTGRADPSSFQAAVALAVQLTSRRRSQISRGTK